MALLAARLALLCWRCWLRWRAGLMCVPEYLDDGVHTADDGGNRRGQRCDIGGMQWLLHWCRESDGIAREVVNDHKDIAGLVGWADTTCHPDL